MLEVSGIHAAYGAVRALENVSLQLGAGQIVCLLGANGAGKTTTLNCISGIVRVTRGQVRFEGEEVTNERVDRLVARGIVQVPEGREIFPALSTQDNLLLGAWTRRRGNGRGAELERVYDLFPRLKERAAQAAGTLSGGEQQMLMLGRALMAKPRLLMFDEPSLGLSPILVQHVFKIIRRIHDEGMTILLVEQNVRMALELSSRGYILENGEVKLQGAARELVTNPQVREAYLGA
jgi:branched-chain amino acid transport system ATP-binding protein